MKKHLCILLALTLAILLSACNLMPPAGSHTLNTARPTDLTPAPTAPSETTASNPTEVPTQPTEPPHSPLYLAHCTQVQMQEYFNEVVLNMEYTDGTGNASLVQKWLTPLYYQFYGNPTVEDRAVLTALFAQLNAIPGFPGIYPAENEGQENLSLSFYDRATFNDVFSSVINGEDAYGATQFWYYTATNDIYTARIGYRTDIDQVTRSSILIEEIINTLGISDTVLRQDSIVYQYSNDNLTLSDVDWVILKVLYDPAIQCGMNATDCARIIQELYY